MPGHRATLVSRASLYAGWLVVVIVALVATSFGDPYVFGFATLGLSWGSAAVAVVGGFALFRGGLSRARRWCIAMCICGALVACGVALRALGTFNWAALGGSGLAATQSVA